MEFTEVVRNRYSCKNFDAGKAVDAAKLTEILEAGRVAPTAKNFQEQKIYVIRCGGCHHRGYPHDPGRCQCRRGQLLGQLF